MPYIMHRQHSDVFCKTDIQSVVQCFRNIDRDILLFYFTSRLLPNIEVR